MADGCMGEGRGGGGDPGIPEASAVMSNSTSVAALLSSMESPTTPVISDPLAIPALRLAPGSAGAGGVARTGDEPPAPVSEDGGDNE